MAEICKRHGPEQWLDEKAQRAHVKDEPVATGDPGPFCAHCGPGYCFPSLGEPCGNCHRCAEVPEAGATLTDDEIETLASDLAQPVHYGLQGCNATSKLPPTLCSTDPVERAGQREFVGNVLRYALHRPEGKAAVERILAARAGLSPEATVVEEWGVRDPSGDDGPFDEDVARRLVADGWQAALIHRTATYRVGLVLDRVTEWTEADR